MGSNAGQNQTIWMRQDSPAVFDCLLGQIVTALDTTEECCNLLARLTTNPFKFIPAEISGTLADIRAV